MTVHEEYTKIIEERYGQYKNGTYEEKGDYSWIFDAPEQYLTEEKMLEYVKSHPKATIKEVSCYAGNITPIGLAPGDDGSDLLVDDD
ncbi:MAG: hypothetical protein LIO41_02175 [Ruminococcus sp.]|nr:hypothetical protein [Ruminococcus sp.]